MTIITAADLRRLKACKEQVAIFQQRWPEGVKLSRENLCEAARICLNLDWWARNAPQMRRHRQAYSAAREQHWEAYDAACYQHWEAYEAACDQHWEAYEAACDQHWEAYEAACDQHWQTYMAACDQHWQTYMAACAEVISDLLGL